MQAAYEQPDEQWQQQDEYYDQQQGWDEQRYDGNQQSYDEEPLQGTRPQRSRQRSRATSVSEVMAAMREDKTYYRCVAFFSVAAASVGWDLQPALHKLPGASFFLLSLSAACPVACPPACRARA